MKRDCIGLTAVLVGLLMLSWIIIGGQSNVELSLFVKVPAGDGYEQISIWQNQDGIYYFFLPAYTNLLEVTIEVDEDMSMMIDGHILYDGMSCEYMEPNVPYEFRYEKWNKTEMSQIIFIQSENVATIHMDTASGNMDFIHRKKGNVEESVFRIYNVMGDALYRGVTVEIKGRGNATWQEYEKKPYSIQFPEAVNLLQMGAAENWILLANSTDPTHLKNKLIYDFADDIGLDFSPDSQWVDLYLNNEYRGLYLLTERNEIHPERVAIQENGWLVSTEFEDRLISQNIPYVSTREGLHLRIHEPNSVTAEQREAIKSYWQSIENAIMAEDNIDPVTGRSWVDLIDIDSWVRRYLIEEIFANGDACEISQFYYTPEPNGATFAGPVWDEDFTLSPRGEWRLSYPNLLAARLKEPRSIWFYELYQKEEFYNHVVYVYQNEMRPMVQVLMDETFRECAEIIETASVMNQIRWDVPYGMEEELDRSLSYLFNRMMFLDQLWIYDTEMVSIQIDSIYGVYRGNILIPVGSYVGHDLMSPSINEYMAFKGWFFADTGEPFDNNRAIYEDMEVFAKWEDSESKKMGQVIKLLPLFVIAVLGILLFLKEIYLNKKTS